MDIIIRKGIWLFVLVFFLLINVHRLSAADDDHQLVSASTTTRKEINSDNIHMKRKTWIEEQRNGTLNICSALLTETPLVACAHKDILGRKYWKNQIKQKHNQCQTLTVHVPKNPAFTEFVDVNKDGELKDGFSIAIFCLVLQELRFKIQPVFVPFINQTGEGGVSYDDLVKKIKGKDCEAAAGDITISANRIKYADFAIPYMSSEIYMLVPAAQKWNQTLVTLIKPFTLRLWLTILCASIFIGVAIGCLEYRAGNPEFKVPFFQKLLIIMWFPISTFFFQEGRIVNRCSKFVLVIWLTMIFIVIQIFTACLSSWLTVNQLQPKVPKHFHVVGYQYGSFVENFARDKGQCPTTVDDLTPLSSMNDYKNALDNGTVDAIFDELPFIDMFLAKYGDNYMKVGPLAEEAGFGFAFSRRNPNLQLEVSRAVVKVITQSELMAEMKKKYLGVLNPIQTKPAEALPQSLDVPSFFLLFIFMALATIIAIICSEISLKRKTAQIFPVISIRMCPLRTISANSTHENAENEQ